MDRVPHGDDVEITVGVRRRFDQSPPIVSNGFEKIACRQPGRRAALHGVSVFPIHESIHNGSYDWFQQLARHRTSYRLPGMRVEVPGPTPIPEK
jgi:hypothetical protein